MSFTLPPLPYELNALEPYISKETLEYHYGKHHNTYVQNLNKLIENTEYEQSSLEDIILKSTGKVFNNAAQVWNHTFYWNCLTPQGGGEPQGTLKTLIDKTFGSFDQFKTEFTEKSIALFGSGWAWLVQDREGRLSILQTNNADTPMTHNFTALMTCDVWEHAYYIDYRNARPKYLDAFWSLVNWDFISSQLK